MLICQTWSITESFVKPASSAIVAARPRSDASVLGPPGQVKLERGSPMSMCCSSPTRRRVVALDALQAKWRCEHLSLTACLNRVKLAPVAETVHFHREDVR